MGSNPALSNRGLIEAKLFMIFGFGVFLAI
jgi:hypothetical protein